MKIYRIANQSNELKALCDSLEQQYNGLSLFVYQTDYKIYVSEIRLQKEMQNQGIGTKVMNSIKEYAKKVGLPVVLHPQADPGKKKKLNEFYKDLGFVDNKGRKRDFSISEPMAKTMYWRP